LKKGKMAFYGLLIFVGAILVFDLWLDHKPDQMTISQMARDAAQRLPIVPVIVGGLFVWLFIHLFWRWKNLW